MTRAELAAAFQHWKIGVIEDVGLAKDALHIYVGLSIFITVRLAWRWRGGWFVAWLAALAAALTGEWIDMGSEALSSALQPDDAHWHDVWNTMFWPTVLALVGRWMQPKAKQAAAEDTTNAASQVAEPTAPSQDSAEAVL